MAAETQNKPYKDMKGRLIVLLIGFVLCVVSFACAIIPILMFFVPGWGEFGKTGAFAMVDLGKILNWIAVGTGFVGIVFAVAGANTKKLFARFSFLFGVIGFLIGLVMALFTTFVAMF